ncbi:MAG: PxKF domain-containing protein, partial [Steroidobacteraceae bacterium]
SSPIACGTGGPGGPAELTHAAGNTTIRYDAAGRQFVYNWQTDRAWSGSCRLLQLTLNDGTEHVASFQFR